MESRCLGHEPCPRCGSKDNLAVYDDGHAWCFTPECGYRRGKDNIEEEETDMKLLLNMVKWTLITQM